MADDQTLIINTLVGWKDPMAAMRNAPGFTISGFGDLTLDYYTDKIRLSIEAHISEHFLRTHILNKADSGLTLVIYYENGAQLKDILSIFVVHQDTVTPENFKDLVKDLVKLGPKIEVETEEGLKPLTI